jgi:hypothetical protein
MNKKLIVAAAIVAAASRGLAQKKPKEVEELRYKLNESGSHYIKMTLLNQLWLRQNESNPGSLVLGEPTSTTIDIGLRRTRFQFYGQLTNRVSFYFQYGLNNFNFLAQNAGNRKLVAFFHDALLEYHASKGSETLILGGGLTITNGLSRFSQPSIGTIMTMDVPVFAQATVDQTDEFSRKLSVFARGQLGRLDYRLVLSDPFPITTNGLTIPATVANSTNASFAQVGHELQYQGFFMWNFFDAESHVTPYMTGTYLGKKKVLNLEAGFIRQKNAMWTGDGVTNNFHDMKLWSVAAYYDAPLNANTGTAVSAYVGLFDYDFGPGYVRYNGIMNPASGITTPGMPQGSQGNAFPMFGTGKVIYAQAGYLLKRDFLGEGNGSLMPFAAVTSANYNRLDKPMLVWDIGVNWFLKGHNSKFTLDYQQRPVYAPNGNDFRYIGTRGQVVLQYQVFF